MGLSTNSNSAPPPSYQPNNLVFGGVLSPTLENAITSRSPNNLNPAGSAEPVTHKAFVEKALAQLRDKNPTMYEYLMALKNRGFYDLDNVSQGVFSIHTSADGSSRDYKLCDNDADRRRLDIAFNIRTSHYDYNNAEHVTLYLIEIVDLLDSHFFADYVQWGKENGKYIPSSYIDGSFSTFVANKLALYKSVGATDQQLEHYKTRFDQVAANRSAAEFWGGEVHEYIGMLGVAGGAFAMAKARSGQPCMQNDRNSVRACLESNLFGFAGQC